MKIKTLIFASKVYTMSMSNALNSHVRVSQFDKAYTAMKKVPYEVIQKDKKVNKKRTFGSGALSGKILLLK